eukprot:scaffold319343_cov19-Tisochrysis_lutea.AAC.1
MQACTHMFRVQISHKGARAHAQASCRPDQAQRVFINNTVSTEDADPSSSQAGKGPGAGEPQFGKESKREPQLEGLQSLTFGRRANARPSW